MKCDGCNTSRKLDTLQNIHLVLLVRQQHTEADKNYERIHHLRPVLQEHETETTLPCFRTTCKTKQAETSWRQTILAVINKKSIRNF
ncbi:hypothetical protein Pmani_034514 [Petrolisthes manimaculis]|uniref:Uncharacterized protein n=1 Tax=Petrolisthes manimaculis TaxID=1843537 RepID=A0AAE1NMD5_9EUCA|nr:hypothetical protein Pmani_034514 [Petrolisthes manimaculis]